VVDEDQPGRPGASRLPAELRADRAAGARDEHRLVAEVRRDLGEVDFDRLAAEDVLDLHRPDLRGEVVVAGDQLVQPRERLDRHLRVTGQLDHLLPHVARGGRDRDKHLVGPVVPEDVGELGGRAEDAYAVDAEVFLAPVIVDEADGRVAERARLQHLADDELPRVSGADDDHLLAACDEAPRGRALEDRARRETRAGDERDQEQPVDDGDSARKPARVVGWEEVEREADEERGDRDAAQRAPHVTGRDVPPPAVVEAERREDEQLDRDDERDRAPADQLLVVGRDARVGVEPQLEGEQPRGDDQPRVGGELPDPVHVDRTPHRTAPSSDTALFTAATTRSCTSAWIPAQSGSARFSRDASSVTGRSPSRCPKPASAGWRWSGVR
jgi:hypothetical protein